MWSKGLKIYIKLKREREVLPDNVPFALKYLISCQRYIRVCETYAGNMISVKVIFIMFGKYARKLKKNWDHIYILIQIILGLRVYN